MSRASVLLIVLLLLPAVARAGEEMRGPRTLDLSRATVLGSPGVPKALEAFLPGGKAPTRLAWPLPKGPLLVLGLPEQDETARRIADIFQLDVDDLGGGYGIWAWRAQKRAMVIVMAADPAALMAARFELDTDAPSEMLSPDMRSLDFKRPNQQAQVLVRPGTRSVRPRSALRAWLPDDGMQADDVGRAAGARANRIWLEAPEKENVGAFVQHITRLRAQGITPAIVVGIHGGLSRGNVETWKQVAVADTTRWQKLADARHFALVFDATASASRKAGEIAAQRELHIVKATADALRPGGLDELVVVPRCHSDRLARYSAPPADLRGIPEAVLAWSGPSEYSTRISRAQAERRVQAAGVPVVLFETWGALPSSPAMIPTLPRGRDPGIYEVLDGVVVVGRRGADATLESAWRADATPRFGLDELAPLVPTDGSHALRFLEALAKNLRAADKENLGLVPWMGPLAREVAAAAKPQTFPQWDPVPVVPQRIEVDGRIDERAWGFATRLGAKGGGRGEPDVLVLSDGDALRVAVRIPKDLVKDTPFLLQLGLEAPGRTDRWHVEVTRKGVALDRSGRDGAPNLEPGHVTHAFRESSTQFAAEITFDRFALGGEPHAGRLFTCAVTWGPKRLWPANGPDGAPGALVVTR